MSWEKVSARSISKLHVLFQTEFPCPGAGKVPVALQEQRSPGQRRSCTRTNGSGSAQSGADRAGAPSCHNLTTLLRPGELGKPNPSPRTPKLVLEKRAPAGANFCSRCPCSGSQNTSTSPSPRLQGEAGIGLNEPCVRGIGHINI